MGTSQDKPLVASYESQRVTIKFKSEEADLEAQEILGRMGKVQYLDDGRVRVTIEMLKVLEEKHIQFELISSKSAPISNTLRK